MNFKYRTDAVPFPDFANELGYNELSDDDPEQKKLKDEIKNHYLTFNVPQIAAQNGEKHDANLNRQFKSYLEGYDRTLAENRAVANTNQIQSIAQNREPFDADKPDSKFQDSLDAFARGVTVGTSQTVSGLGLLTNTVARIFDEDSDLGFDTIKFGEELTSKFQKQFQIDPENEGFIIDVAEGLGQIASLIAGGGVGGATVKVGARVLSRTAPKIAQTLATSTSVLTASTAQQSSSLLDRYLREKPEGEQYDQETVNGLVIGSLGIGLVDSIIPGKLIGNTPVVKSIFDKIVKSKPLAKVVNAPKPLKGVAGSVKSAAGEGITEAFQTILEDIVAEANIQDSEIEEAIDTAIDNISAETTGRSGATGFGVGLLATLLPGKGLARVNGEAGNNDSNPSDALQSVITQADANSAQPANQRVEPTIPTQPPASPPQVAAPAESFSFDDGTGPRNFTVISDTLDESGQTGELRVSTPDADGNPVTIKVNRDLPEAGRFLDVYVAQRNESRASEIPSSNEEVVFDYEVDPNPPVQPVVPVAPATEPRSTAPADPDGQEGSTSNINSEVKRFKLDREALKNQTLRQRVTSFTQRTASKYLASGGLLKDSKDKTRLVRNAFETDAIGVLRAAELYDAGLREGDVEIRIPVIQFQEAIRSDYKKGKLDKKDKDLLAAAFKGDINALRSLPTKSAEAVLQLRSEINNRSAQIEVELESISNRMKERLAVQEATSSNTETVKDLRSSIRQLDAQVEAIRANQPREGLPLGSYVHRTYSIYFDKLDRAEAFNQGSDRYQKFLTYLAKQHKGIDKDLTNEQAQAKAQSDIEQLKSNITETQSHIGVNRDSNILNSISALRAIKQVTPQAREFLGEITDPAVAFSATIHQQRIILSSVEMANNIEQLGREQGWLTDQPVISTGSLTPFSSNSNNPGLTMLNGYYAPSWIVDGLKQHFEIPNVNGVLKVVNGTLGAVKLGKTVGSIGTQVRNFTSGFFSMGVNGSAFNGYGLQQAYGLIKQQIGNKGGGDYHRLLTRLGVVGDGVSTGTLKQIVQDIGYIDRSGIFSNEVNLDQISNGVGALRSAGKFLTRTYAASDDFPKIVGFEQNRDMFAAAYNLPRDNPQVMELAAARVRDTYFTYSKVPRVVKSLRSVPFGPPFISFPAEVYRTSKNFFKYIKEDLQSGNAVLQSSAGKRLVSAAATTYISYNLAEVLGQLAFGQDDEESIERKQLFKEFMEDGKFTKGQDLQVTRELEDGTFELVNMSRYNPYAGVTDVIGDFLRSDADFEKKLFDAVFKAASPFWQPDITLSAIQEASDEYDRSVGSEIDRSKAFTQKIIKGVVPTSLSDGHKIYKTLVDSDLLNVDPNRISTSRAISKALGASTDVVQPLMIMKFKSGDLAKSISDLSSALSFKTKAPDKSSLTAQAVTNQEEVINQKWGRMLKDVEILKRLGYDTSIGGQVYVSMVRSNKTGIGGALSKEQATRLLKGEPFEGIKQPEAAVNERQRVSEFFKGRAAGEEVKRLSLESLKKLNNL